jgi:hypothetical protein
MAGNKAVAYVEPGKVELQTIDYPILELQDGPGVNPANVGRKTPHGVILRSSRPTSVGRTSTWSAAAPPRQPA